MGAEQLITENIVLWTSAIKAKATQGRGGNKKRELYGIKKLRELILELAVRGKLVPQDPNDEPASALLERVAAEKQQLVKQLVIKKPKKLAEIVTDELPFTIPAGWQWARLQDITSYIQRGIGPQYDDFGTVRVVSQKCVQWSGFDLEASRHVANESLGKYQKERFLQSGDLLWNSTGTGTVGRIIELAKIPVNTLVADSHVTVVRPLEVLGGFLKAYIAAPGIQSRFEPDNKNALVSGSTNQVELSTSAVETLEIPVPPKAEQHRIVEKVGELMGLCDQLEQHVEAGIETHQILVENLLGSLSNARDFSELSESWTRLNEHFDTLMTTDYAIEKLKETLLQLAVRGRLVPQDPTHEPASELLNRIAAEKEQLIKGKKIRKQPLLPEITNDEKPVVLPEGWAVIRFGECINLISGQHLKPDQYSETQTLDSVPYITGPADFGERHPVFTKHTKEKRSIAKKGDILITCKGSGIGKLNIANTETAISRQLMAAQVIGVLPGYAWMILSSKYHYFQSKGVGIAIPGISREDVTDFLAWIPPLKEQKNIIDKYDEIALICNTLKARLYRAQSTQLHLADAIVYEVIGEPQKNIENVEVDRQHMKITTTLSLNHEGFGGDAVIAPILLASGGAADAKDVWSKTKLSLPEFYAQLKIEIDAKYIVKPARADF